MAVPWTPSKPALREPSVMSERDFGRWFNRSPLLPDGERVMVIGNQRPLRRVDDLLALDRKCGLVVLEGKAERLTRTAIGG